MGIKFEWDKTKAASNLKKHKISFDEATTVFDDSFAYIFNDEYHSVGERREIIIGQSVLNRLLLVCFTEQQDGIVRIFSTRKTTRMERKDYEKSRKM